MSWRQWTFWACCVEQFVLFCGDTCLNMMMSLPFQARLSSLWLQDKNCLTVSSSQAQVLTVRRRHHVTLLWSSTHVCQWNMWLWRHVHEHAALTSVQQMLKLWGSLPLHQSETIISSWSCAPGCCHGDETQSVNNTSSKGSDLWDILCTDYKHFVLVLKFYIWSIHLLFII